MLIVQAIRKPFYQYIPNMHIDETIIEYIFYFIYLRVVLGCSTFCSVIYNNTFVTFFPAGYLGTPVGPTERV